MIAKESLRIGNWIVDLRGEYQQVLSIERQRVELTQHWQSYQTLEPIPLTEDILINKCGFKNYYAWANTYYNDCIQIVSESTGLYTTIQKRKIKIESVHHLQNLYYALTSNELQVNI